MKILIANDGSEFGDNAVKVAAGLLKGNAAAEIKVVTVIEPAAGTELETIIESTDELINMENPAYVTALRMVTASAEGLAASGMTSVLYEVLSGPPARRIVEAADEWKADLIVVGSHGRGYWSRAMLGSVSDRALLLDFRAANEKKPEKAIKLEKEAVMLISEVTAENALLAANLHANLGGLYKQTSKLELAKQHMETGIHLLEQYGLAPYHDSIPQITNYAVLLTDMGEPYLGLSALQRLSRVIKESNSDVSGDYAVVQEAMGNICLSIGDVLQATTHFKNALAIYEVLFDAEPELIEEKKQDILETYTQAGVQLGRQWLDAKN